MNTVLVVTPSDGELIAQLTDELHGRGLKVVRLANLGVIGFLLASQRIIAVVAHEECLPSEWETMRGRMMRIAPATRIVVVARDEQRSVAELVHAVTS